VNIKAKLYKDDHDDGSLRFLGKGDCIAYEPTIRQDKRMLEPHITLSFGKYRIHLDKDDFLKFVGRFVRKNSKERALLNGEML